MDIQYNTVMKHKCGMMTAKTYYISEKEVVMLYIEYY